MENTIHPLTPSVADGVETPSAAISWGAVFAGAFGAVAVSLVLFILGSALGLTFMSPYTENVGAAAVAWTVATAVWLIVMQWASSAFGGFLAGRLRTKWVHVHTDEIFFRDTAHGFLAWAIATIITVTLVFHSVTGAASIGVQTAGAVTAGAAVASAADDSADVANPMDYYLDGMFRSESGALMEDTAPVRREAMNILTLGLNDEGGIEQADRVYLVNRVSQTAGIGIGEAEMRVQTTLDQIAAMKAEAKEAADTARKAGISFALYTALSMAVGAFIAAVAGAIGGRQRDIYQA